MQCVPDITEIDSDSILASLYDAASDASDFAHLELLAKITFAYFHAISMMNLDTAYILHVLVQGIVILALACALIKSLHTCVM